MDDIRRTARPGRFVAAVLILALSLAAAVAHRRVLEEHYLQPDEEIARAVVSRILVTGKSDTNWARTDVVSDFRYNQFNFSSYYLAAAWIERGLGHAQSDVADPAVLRLHLRELSCVLGGFVVLLAGMLGLRLSAPIAGVAAALLTAVAVSLFQDSIYARPEAFVTLLTLLFAHVCISRRIGCGPMLFVTGLLVGILLAAKVTFAALLPFPLMILVVRLAQGERSSLLSARLTLLGYGLMYIITVAAGFGLGAPYAIAAPWEYAHGIEALLHEYGTGHWPHGVPDASLAGRFSNGLRYLIYTLGLPCLLLAIAALVTQFRRRNGVVVVLALAGPLLTLVYFLQTPVFFERNFSHALPIVFVLCGMGVALLAELIGRSLPAKPLLLPALAVVGVVVLTAYPPLAVSARLFDLLRLDDYLPKVEAEQQRISGHGELSVLAVPTAISAISAMPKMLGGLCGHVIYRVVDYGDPDTQRQLTTFLALGYRLESRVRGPFSGAPTSTLNTYHATDAVFLSSPRDDSDKACRADLVTLKSQHDYAEIKTDISMSTAWQQNAFPSDMDIGAWRSPLFASGGDDANVGELEIGPFSGCGVVSVPFATGPDTTGSELSIERVVSGNRTEIFVGTPPRVGAWSAIRVRSTGDCATYTVRAVDHGAGWGQWLGVGMPAQAVSAKQ